LNEEGVLLGEEFWRTENLSLGISGNKNSKYTGGENSGSRGNLGKGGNPRARRKPDVKEKGSWSFETGFSPSGDYP
jgi:hypothetical protein